MPWLMAMAVGIEGLSCFLSCSLLVLGPYAARVRGHKSREEPKILGIESAAHLTDFLEPSCPSPGFPFSWMDIRELTVISQFDWDVHSGSVQTLHMHKNRTGANWSGFGRILRDTELWNLLTMYYVPGSIQSPLIYHLSIPNQGRFP